MWSNKTPWTKKGQKKKKCQFMLVSERRWGHLATITLHHIHLCHVGRWVVSYLASKAPREESPKRVTLMKRKDFKCAEYSHLDRSPGRPFAGPCPRREVWKSRALGFWNQIRKTSWGKLKGLEYQRSWKQSLHTSVWLVLLRRTNLKFWNIHKWYCQKSVYQNSHQC